MAEGVVTGTVTFDLDVAILARAMRQAATTGESIEQWLQRIIGTAISEATEMPADWHDLTRAGSESGG